MPIVTQNCHNFHNLKIMSSLRVSCNVKLQLFTNDMQNPAASKLEELVCQAIERFLIVWLWFSKVEPSRGFSIARSRLQGRAIEIFLDSSGLLPSRTKTDPRPIKETPCTFCCLVLLAGSLFSWIEESPVPQTLGTSQLTKIVVEK